jgi:F0F1-type ATP synthase membrane subunit b/b'
MSEVRAAAADAAIAAAATILKTRVTGETAIELTDQSIRNLKGQLN